MAESEQSAEQELPRASTSGDQHGGADDLSDDGISPMGVRMLEASTSPSAHREGSLIIEKGEQATDADPAKDIAAEAAYGGPATPEEGEESHEIVEQQNQEEEVYATRLTRSYSCLDEDFMSALKEKAPGFRPQFGGEELQRAFAALSGPTLLSEEPAWGKAARSAAVPGPAQKVPAVPLPVRDVEDPRSRELIFAAKRYSAASIHNPRDFHAAYNHGLVLQELAGIKGRRTGDQERLLKEACERYSAALDICPHAHAVLYNWGVALSDLARLAKINSAADNRDLLCEAGDKYTAALRWNPRNPQALNNLGLVLQDLAQGLGLAKQQQLMVWAAAKFRQAIRQRPDFHRAVYNLGTVYYSHAAALGHHQWPSSDGPLQMPDSSVQSLFQMAAQYVCLAFAMEPFKEVYQRSLSVVRSQLPLPFLRSGHLMLALPDTVGTIQETWIRNWFVLNESSLIEVEALKIEEHQALRKEALLAGLKPNRGDMNSRSSSSSAAKGQPAAQPSAGRKTIRIQLADIVKVQRCHDPSLPAGGALWMVLRSSAEGLYLVAENDEEAECWVDALLLGSFLVEQHREGALGGALRAAPGTQY
mmetsp:Transcript_40188/g.113797  ORF Transcript_40188/g.113797 Transcript_40188/m.113797 type:complete len:590 (-) Transcript_40188:103-1872(-)